METSVATSTTPTINALSDKLFTEIRDYIYDKSGMFFADHKKYLLENRISKRTVELNLKDCEEYLYLIKYGTNKLDELSNLFDAITTNETYFFRNEPQLDAFRSIIIPYLNKKLINNFSERAKIWSAGCSSGEEPYTLSIIFKEEAIRGIKVPYEILATDISREILDKAKKAVYGNYAIRNLTSIQLINYFTPEGHDHRVKDEIRRPIIHKIVNLSEAHAFPLNAKFDVIFCRNVLIYFDVEAKKKVIRKFYDLLNPGGYLFIGHSESLHGITDAFKLVHFEKALAYKKEK